MRSAPLRAIRHGLTLAALTCATPVFADTRFDQAAKQARDAVSADPGAAAERIDAAAKFVSTSGSDRIEQLATLAWLRAERSMRMGNAAGATPYLGEALKNARALPRPSAITGEVLITKGYFDTEQGRVANALADYQRAHGIFQQLNDRRNEARALLNIAMLYGDAQDHANTIKYSQQARDVYSDDPTILITIFNNLSQAYKDLGRYRDAERELRDAVALARKIDADGLLAHLLRNLARVQLLAGHLAAADRSLAEAIPISTDAPPDERAALWAARAQAALQHGDLPVAIGLIGDAFSGVDPTKTPAAFRENHQTAYDIYRRSGDPVAALVHLAALRRLDEQTNRLATSASAALMGARFDFANQELKIANLNRDEAERKAAYERAQAHTQRMIFVGVAGTTLVIIAMLGFGLITIRRSRNEVRVANTDLAATNVALGKALAAKTEFLATTSHEIRTPLNGILGMTQVMLADRQLDAAMRDRIGIVHGAGVTMRALVDDILDVAKMETGNLTVESVAVDLPATLRDVSRLWEEQAHAKQLGFALELGGAPQHVMGDPARLRQIVFNLLANALKFTAKGSVKVRVTHDTQHYRIAVTDTGIGIPADKFEEIFESFRQGDAGTTRQFGGTGLGLTICRNLVQAMNGIVSVDSMPDRGSTFTVELPLVEAEAPVSAADAEPLNDGAITLIVDRSPITRAMYTTILTSQVARVGAVASLDEAIGRVSAGGVERLIVDDSVLRATTDGSVALQTLVTVSRVHGASVILLSAAKSAEERAPLIATGIDLLIGKPFAKTALVAALCDGSSRSGDEVLVSEAA